MGKTNFVEDIQALEIHVGRKPDTQCFLSRYWLSLLSLAPQFDRI